MELYNVICVNQDGDVIRIHHAINKEDAGKCLKDDYNTAIGRIGTPSSLDENSFSPGVAFMIERSGYFVRGQVVRSEAPALMPELTWTDVMELHEIAKGKVEQKGPGAESFFSEVLRIFKNRKEHHTDAVSLRK